MGKPWTRTQRADLAARAGRVSERFRGMEAQAVDLDISDAGLESIDRAVAGAEAALWGVRDRDKVDLELLYTLLEGFASMASLLGVPRSAELLVEHLAKERPDLAERIDPDELQPTLMAFAKKRGKKHAAFHTFAKQIGIAVGDNVESVRVDRVRTRKRRRSEP